MGDYFKDDAIRYSFEFLTSPKWLGIARERLYITVFAGNDRVARDTESAAIWRALGIPEQRIYFLSEEHNWWGPAGSSGPCGPDSEMFVECAPAGMSKGAPGAGGTQLEIWNDVFMQYAKSSDGRFEPLARRCVDTGMGVERTICMLQGVKSIYETELFTSILAQLEELSGQRYGAQATADSSLRIIADHIKAAVMIVAGQSRHCAVQCWAGVCGSATAAARHSPRAAHRH